jgi:predicted small lipoprotein YifL
VEIYQVMEMSNIVKAVAIIVLLFVIAGCCALPDAPGPVGIPLC